MKLDLCKVFGVKENQHFWIKEFGKLGFREYYIKGNIIHIENGNIGTYCGNCFDILKVGEIYYKNPVVLTENTRKWLDLLSNKYEFLRLDTNRVISGAWGSINTDCYYYIGDEVDLQYHYSIDLSFMKENDIYDIKKLLGGE